MDNGMIPALRTISHSDKLTMPAVDRLWCHGRRDLHQHLTPQATAFLSQASALVCIETDALALGVDV